MNCPIKDTPGAKAAREILASKVLPAAHTETESDSGAVVVKSYSASHGGSAGAITITLAPMQGPGWSVTWDRRLKGLLKAAGRRWGFRCVSLTVEGLKTAPVAICDAGNGIVEGDN